MRAAAGRVLARVVGLPPERARVSETNLRQDFGLDTREGQALVRELLFEGLLARDPGPRPRYALTERFVEYATARVINPMPRVRAKHIVAQACDLAREINAEWTRVPLEIEAVAPYGTYLSREPVVDRLELGIMLRVRPVERRARWRMVTRPEGAAAIREAFAALGSLVYVRFVTELSQLPRPFSVAFQAEPRY